MTEYQMLIEKINKISFLLGIATGTLIELSVDESIPFDRTTGIKSVLEHIYKGTNEDIYQ